MNISRTLSALLFSATLALASGAASATNVLMRPVHNAAASDNSMCTGTVCNVLARLTVELQASADGTGASTPTGGGAATGPTAADVAQAQRLVAVLTWQARTAIWSAATQYNCGADSSTTCDGGAQIGAPGQAMWGFQSFNLRSTMTAGTTPMICAAAVSLGASCSGQDVSVSINGGDPVSSQTPDTLPDTAEAFYSGLTPPYQD